MKKGLLLVFATAIISGISIFINKYAVGGINSSVFTLAKNVVVSLLLLSTVIALGRLNELKQLAKKQWAQLAAVGLIGGSIPFLLFFKGLQLTTAATGSFIQKTMFVFVIILAPIFLKEKPSKSMIAATLSLIAGNAMLLGVKSLALDIGTILVAAATLLWACENVLSKYLLRNMSGNVVAFGRMFFGSLFILIFLAATGQLQLVTALSSSQLWWILATSLLLLSYVVTWYNGLKSVNVTVATAILALGSPITTLLYFAAGKAIAMHEITGIIMVVIGVTVAASFSKLSLPHTHSAQ